MGTNYWLYSFLNQQPQSVCSFAGPQIKVWLSQWGVTVTASSLTTSCAASHHFCCCHQPPSFPLSLPPCHHQLPLPPLPLTLQGWVRSTTEHLRKHILEDRMRVFTFYIHNPMSGSKGTPTSDHDFFISSANLVRKLGPWSRVSAAFDFTMSWNQSWVTDLLPKC